MTAYVFRGVRPYGEAAVDIVVVDGVITELAAPGTGVGEVIEADGLIKTYTMGDQTVHALRDVSLRIDEGEFVAEFDAGEASQEKIMRAIVKAGT